MATNCGPPYARGTGCCRCCPPPGCDTVRINYPYTRGCASSSSAGGVTVPCCDQLIPTTLFLTIAITGYAPCDACEGTFPLTYDPGFGWWEIVLPLCPVGGDQVAYRFIPCDTETPGWLLQVTGIPAPACTSSLYPTTLDCPTLTWGSMGSLFFSAIKCDCYGASIFSTSYTVTT